MLSSMSSTGSSHSFSRADSISMVGTSGRMASTRFSIDTSGSQGTVLHCVASILQVVLYVSMLTVLA